VTSDLHRRCVPGPHSNRSDSSLRTQAQATSQVHTARTRAHQCASCSDSGRLGTTPCTVRGLHRLSLPSRRSVRRGASGVTSRPAPLAFLEGPILVEHAQVRERKLLRGRADRLAVPFHEMAAILGDASDHPAGFASEIRLTTCDWVRLRRWSAGQTWRLARVVRRADCARTSAGSARPRTSMSLGQKLDAAPMLAAHNLKALTSTAPMPLNGS